MNKIIIVFAILVGVFSCQKQTDVKTIEICFDPSFLHDSQFNIDIENQKLYYYNYIKEDSYPSYLDTSQFEVKTYDINSKHLGVLIENINEYTLDSNIDYSKRTLEGFTYRLCEVLNNSDTFCLTNSMPFDTHPSHNVLICFFELVYQIISDEKEEIYLEKIHRHFELLLPIKQTGEQPLEYRIWGYIDHEKNLLIKLKQFLKDLPKNKPIIFDLRNGTLSTEAISIFESYSIENEIYFYGFDGEKSIIEYRDYAEYIVNNKYKHAEFYGSVNIEYEINKLVKEKWMTSGILKSFRTRDEVLRDLYFN